MIEPKQYNILECLRKVCQEIDIIDAAVEVDIEFLARVFNNPLRSPSSINLLIHCEVGLALSYLLKSALRLEESSKVLKKILKTKMTDEQRKVKGHSVMTKSKTQTAGDAYDVLIEDCKKSLDGMQVPSTLREFIGGSPNLAGEFNGLAVQNML